MIKRNSRIKDFYKLSRSERLNLLKEFAGLSEQDIVLLNFDCIDKFNFIDQMVENVISVFPQPLGLATNFIVNDRDYLIPMVTEEASVIAAASNAAKLSRTEGGFKAYSDVSVMIGEIHLLNISNVEQAKFEIERNKSDILSIANQQDSILVSFGGGALDLKFKEFESNSLGKVLVVWLLIDVKDAMGANVVNTMCEAVTPMLEKISGGKALLRILSNLSVYRLTRASAVWQQSELGSDVINKIIQANEMACIDVFRAATHNKGIMNGIDAVCIATGNDFRAVEAGCHSYSAINGNYGPLTKYFKNECGNLVGQIEIPLALGVVGGSIERNPFAKLCLKILNVKASSDLANIVASVGLAQNFAALKALVSEGIQKGHMKLHKRNS